MTTSINRSALYSGGVTLQAPVTRLFPAAFLIFWLCGWLAGEVMVSGVVIVVAGAMLGVDIPTTLGFQEHMTNDSVSWFALAFMLVWLTFWTFGGVAAFRHLWKLLVGRERVFIEGGQLTVERFRGPLMQRISWDMHQISGVDDDANITANGRKSGLIFTGSPKERRAVVEAVADAAGVSRPLDWPEDDGQASGRGRRRAS